MSQNPASRAANWPLLYLAVALTTCAALLLELALTRIFSVVFYYHFAFLAISIALFGLGVGGVLSYVVAPGGEIYKKLGGISLLNAALALFAVLYVLTRGADIGGFALGVIYFTTALPFIGTGIIVSLAISETIDRVNKVYFFDLMGAAAGCLALVVLLNTFGGENTIIAVSVIFAAASAIWFSIAGYRMGRVPGRGRWFTFYYFADRELRSSVHRSSLCQGDEATGGAIHQMEQHLAHRNGNPIRTPAK